MLRKLCIVLGHLPGNQGSFFGCSAHHTCLWHVLYFYLCVTYWFRTFTHRIICVHPADTPKIPHFPGTLPGHQGCFCPVFCISSWASYPDTRVIFFRFPAHAQDMYCIFTCVGHIYSEYLPTKLFVYMLQMLQTLRIFPGTVTQTPGLFLWVFCTSQNMYCIFTCVWHIYLGHLPTKLFVYTLAMLHNFHIFLGHLPRHQGCLFLGSPHIPRTVLHFYMESG